MSFWYAFGVTLGAGVCTSLGAAVAFKIRPEDGAKFSVFLAFSAGVMTYLSFKEMLPESILKFTEAFNNDAKKADLFATMFFFVACLVCMVVDHVAHRVFGDEEALGDLEKCMKDGKNNVNKLSTALFTAGALIVHNFPEGLATFYSMISDPNVGFFMAIAIALHNIPQGIAVALPILRATGSRWKAFLWSTFSGLAQPLAGLLAYLISGSNAKPSPLVEAYIFSAIAGIMVYISLIKLFPEALDDGVKKSSIAFILGMGVMAVSLVLMP